MSKSQKILSELFNPFSDDVKDNLVKAFEKRPLESLPPIHVGEGAGVYGIYYSGKYHAYDSLVKHEVQLPIYMGKAVVPGGRKGGGSKDSSGQNYVVKRLKEHSKTILKCKDLDIKDFRCRWLLVAPEFVNAAEAILIDHYTPLWNCLISGFGIHTPGAGRKKQARSDWDMLHPGREFAAELPSGNAVPLIIKKIKEHFKK